jgi:hypothetical protein
MANGTTSSYLARKKRRGYCFLLPDCLACRERLPRQRGLCERCLGRVRKAIAAGQTTWERLEAQGLALPPQKMGEAWMRGFRLGPGRPRPREGGRGVS